MPLVINDHRVVWSWGITIPGYRWTVETGVVKVIKPNGAIAAAYALKPGDRVS